MLRTPFPALLLASVLACVLACAAPELEERSSAAELGPLAPAELPWTDAFMQPALLVADDVRIEGPPGLIAHFVARQEEGVTVEVKTVPEGLRQTFTLEHGGWMEIRGQLDNLQLVVMQRLVVLERVAPIDVVVDARGDVLHRDAQGEVRRAQSLRLAGPVRRTR